MTPLLQYFDLILDSFPVGASHSLCYGLNAGTPFVSMYTTENLRSGLLECLSSTLPFQLIESDFKKYGLLSTPNEYLEFAESLSSASNNLARQDLLHNQRQIVNSILNNPKGMYEDFLSHILS